MAAVSMTPLAVLSRAVSEHFDSDSTKPGVLFSYLPGEDTYYCAVHRYFNSAGRQKEVIVCAKDDNPDAAIEEVARKFITAVARHPETAIEQLRRKLRR